MLQTTKNLNSSYEKLGDTKLGTKIWENTDGRTTPALASRRPLRKASVNAIYIICKKDEDNSTLHPTPYSLIPITCYLLPKLSPEGTGHYIRCSYRCRPCPRRR